MKRYVLLSVFLLTLMAGSCQQSSSSERLYDRENFKRYWYSGKAEISSYKLIQSRYGEQRNGSAVLIFVTEDFSKSKQVKLDDPAKAGDDKVTVLKLNFTKSFVTGIYPYSMMQSIFTPVNRRENPVSLKTTMTSQEWCGQVFTQINLRGNQFSVKSYSYFEQEGDSEFSISKVLLEDELWNIVRLDPASLPIGDVELIPALFFTRLSHVPLKALSAITSLSESESAKIYTVKIPDQNRTLAIKFNKSFPHKILGWNEEFMERGVLQKTSASLDKTLITDYWTQNKNEFRYLRDSLNLSTPQ